MAARDYRSRMRFVRLMLLSSYECGRSEPAWQSVAKLIRVLGVEWLTVE
jgi:hypothetical protein